MAAYCEIVGEHMMANWCTFIICLMTLEGPRAYPSLHPVMAKAFEKPLTIMVLSAIPGREAMETNGFSV